jgi:hypothetical protein
MGLTIRFDDATADETITAGVPVQVPSGGPSRYGLAAVSGPVGPGVRVRPAPLDERGEQPWVVTGVTFVGPSCGTAQVVSTKCSVDTELVAQGVFETVDASVVAAAVLVECGTFSFKTDDEFRAAAADQLNSIQWGAFGHELWSGTVLQSDGVTEGWLSDGTAVDVTTGNAESVGGGSALCLTSAVSHLANFGRQCSSGGELVIHAPMRAIDLMHADNLIVQGEAPGRWRTASGLLVVADAGYTGDGFATPATATEFTMYLTGQVMAVLADPVRLAANIPQVNRHQEATLLPFAFGWLCCHLAVRVNTCLEGC